MEEDTQAVHHVKVADKTEEENNSTNITDSIKGEGKVAENGDLLQKGTEVNKEQEDENALEGGFIKVEKESLDSRDSSPSERTTTTQEHKPSFMKSPRITSESVSLFEDQEKIKDLERELEKVVGELKHSESLNASLKEEVMATKEKLEEGGKHRDELELNEKKLQEKIREAEDKYNSQLNTLQEALQAQEAKHKELVEAQEAKHKELVDVKEGFDSLTVELESSKNKLQELEQLLQSSSTDAQKFEELSKTTGSHAESETKRALEFERLLELAKMTAKEMEDQMASLQNEQDLYEQELSAVQGVLELSKSQVSDLEQTLASKEKAMHEVSKELDLRKVSEAHVKDDILALENQFLSTKEDLQAKVAELEEIKLKVQEDSKTREKVEVTLKSQEENISSLLEELAKVTGEKKSLEAAAMDLNSSLAQMKKLCSDLEKKLKLSYENFSKTESLLSQAMTTNEELGKNVKSLEDLHQESSVVVVTPTQKNIELEDIVRASNEVAEAAKSQVREIEKHLLSVEEKNVELEQQLNLVELKSTEAERELKELSEKTSELNVLLKGVEEEKSQLLGQVHEYEAKITQLNSDLENTSLSSSELQQKLHDLAGQYAEHEGRANTTHQRSLELEDLIQVSHSKVEDAGKRVGELELLLRTSNYNIKELEEQITTLETKCAGKEAESKQFSDKASELAVKLEVYQEKASSLEIALTVANEKERELRECLNVMTGEKKKFENLSSSSILKLSETENLLEVLQNELKVAHEELESIEQDLKVSGVRESETIDKLKSAEDQLEEHRTVIAQATAKHSELQTLHESLVKDSELKLQEAMASFKERDSEATSLYEKVKILEEQIKIYEEQAAEAAERAVYLKTELDDNTVKVVTLESTINELNSKNLEAEEESAKFSSQNELLTKTNIHLTNKVKELQESLTTAYDEKEATSHQLASHINIVADLTEQHSRAFELHSTTESRAKEVEIQLQEAIEKISQKDLEAKDLNEKLHALETQVRIHEEEANEASAVAETRKVQLEETLLKLKPLESIVEEHQTRAAANEKENKALAEKNLTLTQELMACKANMNDLQNKLSMVVSERNETVEQFNSSNKTIEDLKEQLAAEGKRLQSQIYSVMEENNMIELENLKINVLLKGLEEEKSQLLGQMQEYEAKMTQLNSDLENTSLCSSELQQKLHDLAGQCAEHEGRANTTHQRSRELEDLIQVSHSKVEDAGKRVGELELLLQTANYNIKNLEEQITTLKTKCAGKEAESKQFSDKASEVAMELAVYQEKASSLEIAFTVANEKERELTECLNVMTGEKKKFENLSSSSILKLSETENLLEVLQNELKVAHEKLESIEQDLKVSGVRESETIDKLKSAEDQLEEHRTVIAQATTKHSELQTLHDSFVKDSELKLQETLASFKERDFEATSLYEKVKILEKQKKIYEEQAAVAAERAVYLKTELDDNTVKIVTLECTINELNSKILEAEEESAQFSSQNELLTETNIHLTNKVKELQESLTAAYDEKEATSQQLASHINTVAELTEQHSRAFELHSTTESRAKEVEIQLQEVIEKTSQKDLKAKDLNEKLHALETQVRIHEEQANEASAVAETRKVQLEETLLKLKPLESIVEEHQTRAAANEKENKALAEKNLTLTQKLMEYEANMNDLQNKLSMVVSERTETVEQLNSSNKTIEDLKEQLAAEGERLQSQIYSVMEENNMIELENLKINVLLKGLEEEKSQLLGQMQEYEAKMTQLNSDLENTSLSSSELQQKLHDLAGQCAEHEGRANTTNQRSRELEDLIQVSHSKVEDAGKRVGELELLLQTANYNIKNLEEQITNLETKCAGKEAESKQFSDKASEVAMELAVYQEKASSLEIAFTVANENERELTECLNVMTGEKKKFENLSSSSILKLSETENLLEVLQNELKVAHEKLESIEQDLKVSGVRESETIDKLKSAEDQLEEHRTVIAQATAKQSELQTLHDSFVKDSKLKLQETLASFKERDFEATSLYEKVKILEKQKKIYEEQAAVAAERAVYLKTELDDNTVKIVTLECTINELNSKILEAEEESAQFSSQNELLTETNIHLTNKVKELQESLTAAYDEKEATSQQLASHINTVAELTEQHSRAFELHSTTESCAKEVEIQLQEVIEKISQKDLKAKDLNEKLHALETQVRIHEEQANEASAVAETRKVQLEETLLKLKPLESIVEEHQTRAAANEKENKALAEKNLTLTQKLMKYEANMNDLQNKLSMVVSERNETVEQLNSSNKTIEDLKEQLAAEGERLQSQKEAHSKGELEKESSKISIDLEAKHQQVILLEKQVEELEKKLHLADSKFIEKDEEVKKLNGVLAELDELKKLSSETTELEKKIEELENKLKLEKTKSHAEGNQGTTVESKDGMEVKSRDFELPIPTPSKRKSRKTSLYEKVKILEEQKKIYEGQAAESAEREVYLKAELDDNTVKVVTLESIINELNNKILEAEEKYAQFSSQNEFLTETNTHLTNKVKELKESLTAAYDEKEATSQQLASYINIVDDLTEQHSRAFELHSTTESRAKEVEIHLQEAIEKISQKDLEAKDLNEKLHALETQVRIHEEEANEASAVAETRKVHLEETLLKLKPLESIVEEHQTRAAANGKENKALAEKNLTLTQELMACEANMNDLQNKLSMVVSERNETVEQFNSSNKTIEDLKEQLAAEGKRLQSQDSRKELHAIINQLEEQLNGQKTTEDTLKIELENLKSKLSEKFVLQARVQELEQQLTLAESRLKMEVGSIQAVAAENEAGFVFKLEEHARKVQDRDISQSTIAEQKEAHSKGELEKEASSKISIDLEAKHQQVILLEKQVEELEKKLHLADSKFIEKDEEVKKLNGVLAELDELNKLSSETTELEKKIEELENKLKLEKTKSHAEGNQGTTVESKDGMEVKSRDFELPIPTPSKRKSRKTSLYEKVKILEEQKKIYEGQAAESAEREVYLKAELDDNTVKVVTLESIINELNNKILEAEEKYAQFSSQNEFLTETNTHLTNKVKELKESLTAAYDEKEATSQQLASYINIVDDLTEQHSRAFELHSTTESRAKEVEIHLQEAIEKISQKDLEAKDLNEKLHALETQVRIHEEQANEAYVVAETRKGNQGTTVESKDGMEVKSRDFELPIPTPSKRKSRKASMYEKVRIFEEQKKIYEGQAAELAEKAVYLKAELDDNIVKVVTLESTINELNSKILEAEEKYAQFSTQNELLTETNIHLTNKVNELKESLTAAYDEKEAISQQLASHINIVDDLTKQHSRAFELHYTTESRAQEVEIQLQEAIEKIRQKDLEAKDFNEKLHALETQVRIHEEQANEASAVAETRKVQLEETLLILKPLKSIVAEHQTRAAANEKENEALDEKNLTLTQELMAYEANMNDLQNKLSMIVSEKNETVDQLNSSKRTIEDLKEQLAVEGERLQSQDSRKELQAIINQLEEQLNGQKATEDTLKIELKHLKSEVSEKLVLQARVQELEQQLTLAESRLKEEVGNIQAVAAEKEAGLVSKLEEHARKVQDRDILDEKLVQLQKELQVSQSTIAEQKEAHSEGELEKEASSKISIDLEAKHQQVILLEKQVEELEKKLHLADSKFIENDEEVKKLNGVLAELDELKKLSSETTELKKKIEELKNKLKLEKNKSHDEGNQGTVESKDGMEVKSRDFELPIRTPSKRKSRKRSEALSAAQTSLSSSENRTQTTEVSSAMPIKFILGVALVSVILGIILGKRY